MRSRLRYYVGGQTSWLMRPGRASAPGSVRASSMRTPSHATPSQLERSLKWPPRMSQSGARLEQLSCSSPTKPAGRQPIEQGTYLVQELAAYRLPPKRAVSSVVASHRARLLHTYVHLLVCAKGTFWFVCHICCMTVTVVWHENVMSHAKTQPQSKPGS